MTAKPLPPPVPLPSDDPVLTAPARYDVPTQRAPAPPVSSAPRTPQRIGLEDTLLASVREPVSMPASGTVGAFDETTMLSGEPRESHAEPTFVSGERKTATTFSRSTVLPRALADETGVAVVAEQRARYVEGRLLGQGGAGQVIAADDNDICRTVAIKRMIPGQKSPTEIARFIDEIRVVGQLEHPNIVPIHDVGVDETGQYYFVMKYVEGDTLESIIDKLRAGNPEAHRKYTFERRTSIFLSALEAVEFAHARGWIHRDIKPSNIMVGAYGEVMVMDWGIAKRIRTQEKPAGSPCAVQGVERSARLEQTDAGIIIGTPAYMSPEQARGETTLVDERSDIYSLCVLFYELLTLHHYLEGRDTLESVLEGVLHHQPKHPSFVSHPHQSRVPSELGWYVLTGLAKEPSKRFESVAQMRERLYRRLDGDIVVQCPMTFIKRCTHIWMRLVDAQPVVAMLVVGLVVLWLVWGGGMLVAGLVR